MISLICRMFSSRAPHTTSLIKVPRKFPYHDLSLGQMFNVTADKYPEKEMFVFYADKERKTFKQVQTESRYFAASLLSLGLKKGDKMGLLGANHYEWTLAYIACQMLGVVAVKLRLFRFTSEERQQVFKKMGMKALLLTRSPTTIYDTACSLIPELTTNAADNLNCTSFRDLKFVVKAGEKKRGAYGVDELLTLGSQQDLSKVDEVCNSVNPQDPSTIFFSSGSTGPPKAIVHCSYALLNYITVAGMYRMEQEGFQQTWDTKYAVVTDLSSVGTRHGVMLAVTRGCTLVISNSKYDAEMNAKAIQDERCTDSTMLINHLVDLLNINKHGKYDFSSMKIVTIGGCHVPLSLMRKAEGKLAQRILLLYGTTESLTTFYQHPLDPPHIIDASKYYGTGGTEVKIVDTNGDTVATNTPGEICLRGYTMFLRYDGDEEKTKAVKDSDGWLKTGDIGVMDECGYLCIQGRIGEFIKKQGSKLAPGNLEALLDQHPDINNVLVVGVPDGRFGEEVCACIILSPSSSLTRADVVEFCQDKIWELLVPGHVLFVDEFPTTDTGKFDRKRMTEIATKKLELVENE